MYFTYGCRGKRRDAQCQGKLGVSVFKMSRLAHFCGAGDGPVERGRLEMPALRGGERGLWEQSPWVGQDVWREWPQRRPGGWRAGEIDPHKSLGDNSPPMRHSWK